MSFSELPLYFQCFDWFLSYRQFETKVSTFTQSWITMQTMRSEINSIEKIKAWWTSFHIRLANYKEHSFPRTKNFSIFHAIFLNCVEVVTFKIIQSENLEMKIFFSYIFRYIFHWNTACQKSLEIFGTIFGPSIFSISI